MRWLSPPSSPVYSSRTSNGNSQMQQTQPDIRGHTYLPCPEQFVQPFLQVKPCAAGPDLKTFSPIKVQEVITPQTGPIRSMHSQLRLLEAEIEFIQVSQRPTYEDLLNTQRPSATKRVHEMMLCELGRCRCKHGVRLHATCLKYRLPSSYGSGLGTHGL